MRLTGVPLPRLAMRILVTVLGNHIQSEARFDDPTTDGNPMDIRGRSG